jgi:hypothetical protein
MVRLNQRIQIELENIADIFTEMPLVTSLPQLSKLEIASVNFVILEKLSVY